MKHLKRDILFIAISLLFLSCISYKIPKGEHHVFTGKQKWSEKEKACAYKAMSNIESAGSTFIIFRKYKIKSMGQAQPLLRTILRKPEKRIYIISVRDSCTNPDLNFGTIPDSAKTGLIGHEIMHVIDYKSRNILQVAVMGIKYTWCKKYRRKTEWMTDSLTIVNNMGYEVLCFTDFIYNSPYVSEKYLKKKKKFYMKQEDIKRIIDSTGTKTE